MQAVDNPQLSLNWGVNPRRWNRPTDMRSDDLHLFHMIVIINFYYQGWLTN